ncbi:MAG: aldehyde dehydrogenase [marine bacterium B5-7]|nr:MAG: aldehyde dehydrogenase [marine bacterium B5-7]
MQTLTNFYINGAWVAPTTANDFPVIDPSSEEQVATITLGSEADVDRAVNAARSAFASWGWTDSGERVEVIENIASEYEKRMDDMAEAISTEMGAPIDMARTSQAGSGLSHLRAFARTLKTFKFEQPLRDDAPGQVIIHEPIGVAALITPWNWPMNQVTLKVGAALAAGCTMILKPAEVAPLSSMLFAEIIDAAGVPAGVFNLVNGDGPGVGSALSSHPLIDVVSFTGSTRAGISVSHAAADQVKRVSLELGGKSPNLIFADCDVKRASRHGAAFCFNNTGQSCNAPTRMLVERSAYDTAVKAAAEVAASTKIDLASNPGKHIGPLVSQLQYDRVQKLLETGVAEGARLVVGGPGRADGFNRGYFVKPTVFADVTPEMTIYREEIFGPVLSITPFDSEDEAVAMANDTPYGLAAYLQTGDADRARRVSRQLRAGMVQINGAQRVPGSPFGGYKQSGNGREGGAWGIEEFLEVKAISEQAA